MRANLGTKIISPLVLTSAGYLRQLYPYRGESERRLQDDGVLCRGELSVGKDPRYPGFGARTNAAAAKAG